MMFRLVIAICCSVMWYFIGVRKGKIICDKKWACKLEKLSDEADKRLKNAEKIKRELLDSILNLKSELNGLLNK